MSAMLPEPEPDIDIVIVSFNTCDMLRQTLYAIPAALDGLRARTTVVDNASQDASADMIAAEFPTVRLIRSETNTGFARGNNIALHECTAPTVLLLNPDTSAAPRAFHVLADFLHEHPDAAVVGPMLQNTDGSLQPNGRRFPCLMMELVNALGAARLVPRSIANRLTWAREGFDTPAQVDQVSGACMLVRQEAIRQVGILDERFFLFFEEVEWCRRFRQAGWRTWYVPEARVTHHWMGSVRQAPVATSDRYFDSMVAYYRQTDGALAGMAASAIAVIGRARARMMAAGSQLKRLARALMHRKGGVV